MPQSKGFLGDRSSKDGATPAPALARWVRGWWACCWGVVLGTALQLQQAALWPWTGYAVLGAVGAVAWWGAGRFRAGWWHWGATLLAVAALQVAWAGGRALLYQQGMLAPALEGQDLTLQGRVLDLPRHTERGVRFAFAVEAGWLGERAVAVPGTVLLAWNGAPWRSDGDGVGGEVADGAKPLVRTGQRWRLVARLQRPHGLSNPHGFDTELWLWGQGLQATGQVRTGRQHTPPVVLSTATGAPIASLRQALRDALLQRVPDPQVAGILAGLVVGDQAGIDAADWEVFRATGTSHLIAISGLHITLFAALAMPLVGAAWRAWARWWPGLLYRVSVPTAAAVGGCVCAALYAVLAGWGVPAQRTVMMLVLWSLLRCHARRWPWPLVWASVMALVLVLDPWAWLQVGFWLSFVAVAVLMAALGGGGLAPSGGWAACRRLWHTQWVVTLALAPLSLLWFGQLSVVGLVANLLAVPWVTGVVTPFALAGALFAPLWGVAAWATQGMMVVLEWLAAWPGAVWWRPALPWPLGLAAVAGAVWWVLRGPRSLRWWGLLCFWPALVYEPPRPAMGHFEVVAPDVGQGSAVLVRTATHTLLHDGGPPMGAHVTAAERVLWPWLRAQGDAPDTIVVSHADSDHASGLPWLAQRFPRAALSASFDTQAQAGRSAQRCEAGQQWVWDGVRFEVLHPQARDYAAALEDNALSCVLRVSTADAARPRVALLTGDIGVQQEARLVAEHPGLRADLLLAPHHGSKTSSSGLWLDALRPRHTIIQSGYRNRYGHPSPVVLARYEARGLPWVASPDCGLATWRSEDPDRVRCHRVEQRRYWHAATSQPSAKEPLAH